MFTNKDLKRLIFPLVIEQTLVMLVGMLDVIMVSQVGEAAISGVALSDMVNQLIIVVLAALATGGAVVVSQYLGDNKRDTASDVSGQLIMVSFLISVIIMILSLVFHTQILSLFFGSVEDNVMKAAKTYFIISALSFPFLGVYNSNAAIFRSMNRTKTTMYVSIIMNIINFVGNLIGVFVFKAGVMGVAIPTLVSRIVASIIIMKLAFFEENLVRVHWANIFSYKPQMIKKVLNIAIPNGIENSLFTLGKILVTSIVALFGTTQIAANGVANSINMLAIIFAQSINLAMVTVVGQSVGAKEFEQASMYVKKLMKASWIGTSVLSISVIVLLPLILNFYTLSNETYKLTFTLIVIHNLFTMVFHPTAFNLANAIRATGDVKFTMFVGIGSMFIFRLGTAYILGIYFNMGVIGVYFAMIADWIARSVAFVFRFKSNKWREFSII